MMGEVPTQAQDNKSSNSEYDKIKEELADMPVINKETPLEERRELRAKANELSKKAGELRKKEIENDSSLDAKSKKILTLYNEGKQVYAIAQEVYDFANKDTVGQVMLTIRKAHADDFNEVEDINSTKGYTGVGATS